MERFKELLKGLEYTDEQIEKIVAGMSDQKIYLSGEENIDERYSKLKGQHGEASQQLKDANDLIKQLQEAAKGNEGLQTKITDYETKVAEAEARAAKAERDSAIKVELLAKGAVADDVDYLMWRIDNGDTEVKVGKDGKLTGIDDVITTLKTAHPNQFKSEEGKKLNENKLPGNQGDPKPEPKSLEEALRAQYENNN